MNWAKYQILIFAVLLFQTFFENIDNETETGKSPSKDSEPIWDTNTVFCVTLPLYAVFYIICGVFFVLYAVYFQLYAVTFCIICGTFVIICSAFVIICGTFRIICSAFVNI